MSDAGHRTITTVQRNDGSLTSEPTAIFQATQDSFLRQHTPTQEALDPNSQHKVTCPLRILNHAQRKKIEKHPFAIQEVQKAM